MFGLAPALRLADLGLVPDWLARYGIRKLLQSRLREEDLGSAEANEQEFDKLVEELKNSPVAIATDKANEQHYELPPEFFQKVLGTHLKYSSCHWGSAIRNLSEAEAEMLRLTCERAGLKDGQNVLELGCGWGSLTLWMAEHFPNSRIFAMSNSSAQRDFIMNRAIERGLHNIQLATCDINEFTTDLRFDRVVSIEMFEHVRNYELLMSKISNWLRQDGKLFVHIFCHVKFAYPFEVEGADNWMGRYFFTGGLMPSDELLYQFQDDLKLEYHWQVNGIHYSKTARAWLNNLDGARPEIEPILAKVYGEGQVTKWRERWRLFFMACEELFGFRNGQEWIVSHYRFRKP